MYQGQALIYFWQVSDPRKLSANTFEACLTRLNDGAQTMHQLLTAASSEAPALSGAVSWQPSQDDFCSQQDMTLFVHSLAQCMLVKSSVSSSCSCLNDATIEVQHHLVV